MNNGGAHYYVSMPCQGACLCCGRRGVQRANDAEETMVRYGLHDVTTMLLSFREVRSNLRALSQA